MARNRSQGRVNVRDACFHPPHFVLVVALHKLELSREPPTSVLAETPRYAKRNCCSEQMARRAETGTAALTCQVWQPAEKMAELLSPRPLRYLDFYPTHRTRH